jgi:hypothetical protein
MTGTAQPGRSGKPAPRLRSRPDAADRAGSHTRGMVARAVEQARSELRELHLEAREQIVLAALAFALAVAASELYRGLAVPFLAGGFAALFLFVRALTRRYALVDSLVADRDAYLIPEVRRRAEESATMEHRRSLAATIDRLLAQPDLAPPGRIAAEAEALRALAAELEDDSLVLDPACAVACDRLLESIAESPLLCAALPAEDAHSRINQIRCGFRPRAPGRPGADGG